MTLASVVSIGTIGEALLFVGVGALIGGVHFAALRWNVQLFLADGSTWRAVGLQLLRMVLTAGALFGCACVGALPLLAALAGLLLVRRLALRRVGDA